MAEMPASLRGWRTALACVLAIGVAACVLHREVLFGGSVYHMDDAADGYYPGHIAVARAFAHGELPTWERGSWCGWPLVVDPYNGVFYPLNAIYYLVGAARGLGFAVAMHIVLGGVGVWLFLRRRRLALEVALFGALAYALSTFGVVRIRHVIFVQMMGWLPWILVGVEGWMVTRKRRELGLVAVATGLALLAGALSIGHFAALVIGGYTIARCAARGREEGWRRGLSDAGVLALAALLGALLAAVQLAPTLAHLPLSPRALGSDYGFASSYAWPNLRYLYTLVAPDVYGGEDRASYFGAPNHWELCGWYTGALCAVAAPFAFLPPRALRRRGGEVFVLAALVVLAILLALGDAAPVHRFFFRFVPLYASLRCPARALLMAVLAVPILGAHGVEALLERARATRRPNGAAGAPRATLVGWVIAAAILVAGIAIARRLFHLPHGTPPRDAAWLRGWAHFTWVVASGIAITVAALAGNLPRRAAGLGLALVLTIDLLQVGRGYLTPQPAAYPSGMERFAAVDWLREHAGGDRFVNDPDGPFRLHNVGMVLGLENASGYDSVAIWRYVDFLYLIAHGRPYPEKRLANDFAGIGVHNLSSRLIDLMNVRWLIATHAPPGDDPKRWVERFHPTPPTGAPAAEFEPGWDPRLNVYENLHVLRRAFIVFRASVPGSDERLAARLVDPTFDPATEVLLEEAPPRPLDGPAGRYTPANVAVAERHRLAFDTDAPVDGMLVVSEVWYPGWRATVDGRATEIYRADWAFRAVAIPAGRHRVEMRYTSWPVAVGAVFSTVAVIGVVALARLRRRRREAR